MFALLYETLLENTFLMTDLNPELFFNNLNVHVIVLYNECIVSLYLLNSS